MAELLVYNATHWMENSPTVDKTTQKYKSRYQKGNVIQVYEDGSCTEPPAPNSKFIILKVPDLSVAEAEAKYMQEEEGDVISTIDGREEKELLHRRKVRLDLDALPSISRAAISNIKQARITKASLDEAEGNTNGRSIEIR